MEKEDVFVHSQFCIQVQFRKCFCNGMTLHAWKIAKICMPSPNIPDPCSNKILISSKCSGISSQNIYQKHHRNFCPVFCIFSILFGLLNVQVEQANIHVSFVFLRKTKLQTAMVMHANHFVQQMRSVLISTISRQQSKKVRSLCFLTKTNFKMHTFWRLRFCLFDSKVKLRRRFDDFFW